MKVRNKVRSNRIKLAVAANYRLQRHVFIKGNVNYAKWLFSKNHKLEADVRRLILVQVGFRKIMNQVDCPAEFNKVFNDKFLDILA